MLQNPQAIYLVSLLIFLLGLGGLATIVFAYAPADAPGFAYAGLYFSVFLMAFGAGTVFLCVLKKTLGWERRSSTNSTVFRQALILGFLASGALALQAFRLFNILTVGLLVLCVAILELYFLNR